MWPFLGPLVVNPEDPDTEYQENPFTNPSSFADHAGPHLQKLVDAGYDHVRLPVAPGPWLDAVRDGDEERIEYLFTLFDEAVDLCLSAGLRVMIDMHDSYYVRNMPPELLASGIGSARWQRRIEVTRRFAARYRSRSKARLCLELFNEPLAAGSISGNWRDYLWSLYQAARAAMPNHTILVTAENWSDIDSLVNTDPTPYGKNVLWVIHPYIPTLFGHQGYRNGYNNWVSGLAWPPNPADKASAIAAMEAAIDADQSVSDKAAQKAFTESQLDYYFDAPLGEEWIAGELDKIDAWLTTHDLTAGHIVANEYGVTRDNASYDGAPAESRAPYIAMMNGLLDAKGFRKTIFALDAPDYGITDGEGSDIGDWIAAPTA